MSIYNDPVVRRLVFDDISVDFGQGQDRRDQLIERIQNIDRENDLSSDNESQNQPIINAPNRFSNATKFKYFAIGSFVAGVAPLLDGMRRFSNDEDTTHFPHKIIEVVAGGVLTAPLCIFLGTKFVQFCIGVCRGTLNPEDQAPTPHSPPFLRFE